MNNVDSFLQNHVCPPVCQSTFLSSPTTHRRGLHCRILRLRLRLGSKPRNPGPARRLNVTTRPREASSNPEAASSPRPYPTPAHRTHPSVHQSQRSRVGNREGHAWTTAPPHRHVGAPKPTASLRRAGARPTRGPASADQTTPPPLAATRQTSPR